MSLSLDGSAHTSGSGPLSVTLSTSLTDDIIVAVVSQYYAAESLLSISGAGLTWARRTHVSAAFSGSAYIEVWWAHAPVALTGQTITANWTGGGSNNCTFQVFAVNGADTQQPFDPNSSLPAIANIAGGGSGTHPVTSISTTNANTFEFALLFSSSSGASEAADSTFTLLANLNPAIGATQSEYKTNSSTLSGVSQNVFASFSSVTSNYVAYIDAVQAAPTAAWAGPKFVNSGAIDLFASGTSTTPALPSSRVNGNLLLAHCSLTTGSVAAVWPAGWTVLENWAIGSQNGSKAYCYVTGSEVAPAITWTVGSLVGMARVDQFSNVKASSPVGAVSHSSASSTAITSAAITTTQNNSLIFNYADLGWSGAAIPSPVPHYTTVNYGFASSPSANWQASIEQLATSGSTSDSVSVTAAYSGQWLDFLTEILAAPTGSVGLAGGSATVSGVAAEDVVGTAGGSATVSGVGAEAIASVGTAGGSATVVAVPGGSKGTTGGSATLEGYAAIFGQLNSTETPDNFSAYGSQPISGTWGSTEHADRMIFIGTVPGVSGPWSSIEAVDKLTMIGYPASVGAWVSIELKDRFTATGSDASFAKPRRIFFTT